MRIRTALQALNELFLKAENKDCYDWLKANVGDASGEDLVEFTTEENLDHLPCREEKLDTSYLQEQIHFKLNRTKSTADWARFVNHSDTQVPVTILALFLHTVAIGEALAPCQPDVNGKRFTEYHKKGDQTATDFNKACNTTAFVYTVKRDDNQNGKSTSGVLPMTYAHSLQLASLSTTSAKNEHSRATLQDVLKVFDILLGSRPDFGEDNDKSASEVFLLLLCYMTAEYYVDRNVDGGWKRLLTAIGKHVFGEEACIERLNQLCLSNKNLPAVTVAIFASIIPLKLAFLSAESFVVGAHQSAVLGTPNRQRKMNSTTNILEYATSISKLPYNNLKHMSNELNTGAREGYDTGSIMDFCLEMLLNKRHSLIEDNAEYEKDFDASASEALTAIVEGAKHNPHLGNIIDTYKIKLMQQGGERDINQHSLDNFELPYKDILENFKKNWGNAKIFAEIQHVRGPKTIMVLMIILTDFCDESSAKALSALAEEAYGVSRLACLKPIAQPCTSHSYQISF